MVFPNKHNFILWDMNMNQQPATQCTSTIKDFMEALIKKISLSQAFTLLQQEHPQNLHFEQNDLTIHSVILLISS